MKKILFTTVTMLMGLSLVFSQNLSLVFEGNPIPANYQIYHTGLPNNDEMVVEVEVTNNSSYSMDVLVKKVENIIIPGSVNTFCWAGLCYPPFIYVSPGSTTIPAGGTSPVGEFSGHYNPQSYAGQSSISYVFFDMNNPNDSVMVTIFYNATTTGFVQNNQVNFTISDPYPNPANQYVKFDIDVNRQAQGNLKIYSLVGALIKEIEIADQSGTLEITTDKLQEGFYFYVLTSSGKELKTGRFIVRH